MKVRVNFTKGDLSSHRTSAAKDEARLLLETYDLRGGMPIKVDSRRTSNTNLIEDFNEYITPGSLKRRYFLAVTMPSIWTQLRNKVDMAEAGALKYFKGTIGFFLDETNGVSHTVVGTVLKTWTDDKGILLQMEGIYFNSFKGGSSGNDTLITREGEFYFKIPYWFLRPGIGKVEVLVDNYDKKSIDKIKSFIESNKKGFKKFKDLTY